MKCKFPPCRNEVPQALYYGRAKNYCSPTCTKKAAVNKLRRNRKIEAVNYLGGSCQRCGFNENLAALQFHHRDPNVKEFGINRGISKNFESVKAELDKCDLLCANCHATVHALLAQVVERDPEEVGAGGASPSESTNSAPEPLHGTRARYLQKYFKCRCDLCKHAQKRYMRAYNDKVKLRKFG